MLAYDKDEMILIRFMRVRGGLFGTCRQTSTFPDRVSKRVAARNVRKGARNKGHTHTDVVFLSDDIIDWVTQDTHTHSAAMDARSWTGTYSLLPYAFLFALAALCLPRQKGTIIDFSPKQYIVLTSENRSLGLDEVHEHLSMISRNDPAEKQNEVALLRQARSRQMVSIGIIFA